MEKFGLILDFVRKCGIIISYERREKVPKTKKKNVSFNKSGTGGITPKITLPKKWLDKMGITEDEREVEMEYKESEKKGKRIIITKSED